MGMVRRFAGFAAFSFFVLIGASILCGVADAAVSPAAASDDVAAKVICNVVTFVQKLGLPIMTGVILGSSMMALFGRLAWPAIVMLVVFTAIFFGAGKLIQKFASGIGLEAESFECKGDGQTSLPSSAAAGKTS